MNWKLAAALPLVLAGAAIAGPEENAATSRAFFRHFGAGDMAAWLATMAPDIRTWEPVGTPPNVGHEGVLAWAGQMGQMGIASAEIDVRAVHPAGDSTAVEWTTTFTFQDGRSLEISGVDIHRFDEDGLIAEVRGYYDPSPLMAAKGEN
ncbi:MAG: DUF4440 domain-containing protein [Alphaproteobacteria bacterium]|nr:MAG: DUF4440 domain-containing protein [Alphaproteobacteria bacterium]